MKFVASAALITGLLAGCGAGGADPAVEDAPGTVAESSSMADGSFVVEDVRIDAEPYLETFRIIGRVTNRDDIARTGLFTLTLLKNGSVVTSGQGAVQNIGPGETVTVDFTSLDPYVADSYDIDFQADLDVPVE
jgi:hypothetical protein